MNQGKKPSWFPECPWGEYEKDKFKYRDGDTHDYINDSAEIRVREYIKGKSIIPEIKPSLWQRFVWWVYSKVCRGM